MPLLMAGTTLGWSSPMMEYVAKGTSPVHLDSSEESWMVTYIDIGNVLLSIPAGILMDRIGRKMSVFLTIPITLAGWILILTARQVSLLAFFTRVGVWFSKFYRNLQKKKSYNNIIIFRTEASFAHLDICFVIYVCFITHRNNWVRIKRVLWVHEAIDS